MRDVADVRLSPASYESDAVGRQLGVRKDWVLTDFASASVYTILLTLPGFPHAISG